MFFKLKFKGPNADLKREVVELKKQLADRQLMEFPKIESTGLVEGIIAGIFGGTMAGVVCLMASFGFTNDEYKSVIVGTVVALVICVSSFVRAWKRERAALASILVNPGRVLSLDWPEDVYGHRVALSDQTTRAEVERLLLRALILELNWLLRVGKELSRCERTAEKHEVRKRLDKLRHLAQGLIEADIAMTKEKTRQQALLDGQKKAQQERISEIEQSYGRERMRSYLEGSDVEAGRDMQTAEELLSTLREQTEAIGESLPEVRQLGNI